MINYLCPPSATGPTCSRPRPMWQSMSRAAPRSTKSPRAICPMKPLPPFLPRPRNMWAFPMCGAAPARTPLLTARALCPMSTINAAGTSGGWGRRGSTTYPPAQAAPSPVILCSSWGLMTRRACPIVASMWGTAGCSTVEIPSSTPT